MDEIDRSNEQAEYTLKGYIDQVRRRAAHDLKPSGFCYNCAESLRGRLFCDSECREDYERRDTVRRKTTS